MLDRSNVKISVFINDGQLPVTSGTTLTQGNLHNFKLPHQKDNIIIFKCKQMDQLNNFHLSLPCAAEVDHFLQVSLSEFQTSGLLKRNQGYM